MKNSTDLGMLNLAPRIKTKVYLKPTNTGLLLHYQSHVDNRYKRSQRSSLPHIFWLDTVFLKLKYPKQLFNLAVKQFVDSKVADQQLIPSTDTTTYTPPIRVIIPFKDQVYANVVKKSVSQTSAQTPPIRVIRPFKDQVYANVVKKSVSQTSAHTPPIRVIRPFKDQVSANVAKKRLTDLSSNIKTTILARVHQQKTQRGSRWPGH